MKVIDSRDKRVIEGELVTTLAANQPVSILDMHRFYKAKPADRNYDMLSAACSYDRVVLRRGDVEDVSYYIVPLHPFYQVEKD